MRCIRHVVDVTDDLLFHGDRLPRNPGPFLGNHVQSLEQCVVVWCPDFIEEVERALQAPRTCRVSGDPPTVYETYRNLTLTTTSGIPGPLIAGYLVRVPKIGRKYTMVIGALSGMALLFGFTGVKTQAQNVGISCAISCCINIYYATFFAYTVEVLPSPHRATGNGLAVSFNRVMGIVSAFVASSGNTSTAVPLYVCAALFGGLAVIAALFPFEPQGRRSS